MEGFRSEFVPGFHVLWYECFKWFILLPILIEVVWEHSTDVLYLNEIWYGCWPLHQFHNLSHFFYNGKWVSMRCLAEKSSLDHLGDVQTAKYTHSEFSNIFVNYVWHLGRKESFVHCISKRPIPWANHHFINCSVCSSDLSSRHVNRFRIHLVPLNSIFFHQKE